MPHIACISAANMRHARQRSTSTRACQFIAQILAGRYGDAVTVDIVSLVDHELRPCHESGACFAQRACPSDEAFNALYARLVRADALFVVAPHYAPIPTKLCMLLVRIIGLGDAWPQGVIFPIQRVRRDPDALFPVQEYGWDDIRRRIEPLVLRVVEQVKG
jgi:hypothetical protein